MRIREWLIGGGVVGAVMGGSWLMVNVWGLGGEKQAESGRVVLPPQEREIALFRGESVSRVGGLFKRVIGGVLVFIEEEQGKLRWMALDKDAKVVCQPTGELNTPDARPAQGVFIEDKQVSSAGIPWGVEIHPEAIRTRVAADSPLRVYYSTRTGPLFNTFTAQYVWFGSCYE